MKLGIFAKTFNRPTLEETLDAIAGHGLRQVQFNLVCAGLPTLPERIEAGLCARIRSAFQSRHLTMAAVSGTFNLIDPDPSKRQAGLDRLRVLIEAAPDLETNLITLCTGTRDPQNMWAAHPENCSEGAWSDLLHSIETALGVAEARHVTLGIEPELANVVSSAAKARRLLDNFGSPYLKIVMDPANLFPAGQISRMQEIIGEAFELLGKDIRVAHAKDLSADGRAGQEAAGTGLLDYDYYIGQLSHYRYEGPLILHSLAESQVNRSLQFLKERMAQRHAQVTAP